MKVVVGLGNPGPKYRRTRHNVGFDVLAELARRHGAGSPSVKHEAEIAEAFVGGEKTLLVAPQTYMNLSGRAVWPLVEFYKLDPENLADELLVVCDDMNLDFGRLRMRAGGSAGGQKGLQNIIQHLGTEEVPRLRVGIGRPPGRMDGAAYVLARFTEDEAAEMEHTIPEAADGVELWIREGIETAMNRVNAPKDRADDTE
jgi:PTH1 family peptidyl-tRNA hydrolase